MEEIKVSKNIFELRRYIADFRSQELSFVRDGIFKF